jgi:hypothetical protein
MRQMRGDSQRSRLFADGACSRVQGCEGSGSRNTQAQKSKPWQERQTVWNLSNCIGGQKIDPDIFGRGSPEIDAV